MAFDGLTDLENAAWNTCNDTFDACWWNDGAKRAFSDSTAVIVAPRDSELVHVGGESSCDFLLEPSLAIDSFAPNGLLPFTSSETTGWEAHDTLDRLEAKDCELEHEQLSSDSSGVLLTTRSSSDMCHTWHPYDDWQAECHADTEKHFTDVLICCGDTSPLDCQVALQPLKVSHTELGAEALATSPVHPSGRPLSNSRTSSSNILFTAHPAHPALNRALVLCSDAQVVTDVSASTARGLARGHIPRTGSSDMSVGTVLVPTSVQVKCAGLSGSLDPWAAVRAVPDTKPVLPTMPEHSSGCFEDSNSTGGCTTPELQSLFDTSFALTKKAVASRAGENTASARRGQSSLSTPAKSPPMSGVCVFAVGKRAKEAQRTKCVKRYGPALSLVSRTKRRSPGGCKAACLAEGRSCTQCGAQTTPVWRAGPLGPKTLCNACGVRYMKVAKKK